VSGIVRQEMAMSYVLRIVTVTVLPLILVSRGVLKSDSPEKIIPAVIKNGRLSKLPESPTDIQAYAWNTAFSGEWYLAFVLMAWAVYLSSVWVVPSLKS
jgi:hypothetical protein